MAVIGGLSIKLQEICGKQRATDHEIKPHAWKLQGSPITDNIRVENAEDTWDRPIYYSARREVKFTSILCRHIFLPAPSLRFA